MMAEVKNVRKRKAEPLSEQQCVLPATVLSASGNGFLSDPLVFSSHHHHHHHLHHHHGYVPPTKLFLQMHHHSSATNSTSCSSGSLLDESSRGEFSTGDACSELDFSSDANTAAGRRKQRHETSLGQLTKKFVALLNQAQDGEVNLNDASTHLKVQKRRIYDITNVLEGVGLLHKTFKNKIKWIGTSAQPPEPGTHAALAAQVLSGGSNSIRTSVNNHKRTVLNAEMKVLEAKEKELERKIQLAMNNLQQMTEDEQNKRYAFLTYLDIKSIDELSNQTVIAIKAPTETKLEVPDPNEKLQMWLKSDKGEIEVYICPENSNNNNNNNNNAGGNHKSGGDQCTSPDRRDVDAGQGESINSELDNIINNPSRPAQRATASSAKVTNATNNNTNNSTTTSNNGQQQSPTTQLKHAFISEDDDLGLMGARNLQMQTDDQSNQPTTKSVNNNNKNLNCAGTVRNPRANTIHNQVSSNHNQHHNHSQQQSNHNHHHHNNSHTLHNNNSTSTTSNNNSGVNQHSSNINSSSMSAAASPGGSINDLLFLHLEPPLSEDDYNFALEDSEGIADLFGEMLPGTTASYK